MNQEEQKQLKKIIESNSDLFFNEGKHLSHTHKVQHEIVITNNNAVYSKIYRYPNGHEEEINKQIDDILKQNIITESTSAYNSPLWIVQKKRTIQARESGE